MTLAVAVTLVVKVCRPCVVVTDMGGGVDPPPLLLLELELHSLLDELEQLPLPLHVVVSTTTSGWTTISCDDVHDGGSSVMVVSDKSEPRNRRGTYVTDGLLLLLLLLFPLLPLSDWERNPAPLEWWSRLEQRSMHGDGNGVGVAIRSSPLAGITFFKVKKKYN